MPPSPSDALARELIAYVDASPTPYHAVFETSRRLQAAGFQRLHEEDAWALEPGQRVFVTRGDSSIAAFILGARAPSEAGFDLIGAHTDSPNLRVKPAPDVRHHGYRQLAVEVYGGVLLSTWLDRDLSLAGRVLVGSPPVPRLVDFGRPLLRIPNLAIHLNRNVNTEGLVLNPQRHMVPLLGLDADNFEGLSDLLARELGRTGDAVSARDIGGWDLCLYDTQPGALAGVRGEFIHSARLDNLASCFAAVEALVRAGGDADKTRGIVLYDHEEVGSASAQGADSPFLRSLLQRLAATDGDPEAWHRALARSFLISTDMAHALHPNYVDRHEPGHRPLLGKGPVIKSHASQAYATDGESWARFMTLCRAADVTPQHFVSRSDMRCGSTIGPITASQLGVRTLDIGNPLLSMHSVREMAASADVGQLQRVLDRYFASGS